MKIKKALGVCTLFASMMLMTAAVQAATYTVESKNNVAKDGTIDLTITATPDGASEDINGFAISVDYDSDVLTPQKATGTDATGADLYAASGLSSGVFVADNVENSLKIAWADETYKTITGETTIATVTFAVSAGDSVDSTDVDVTVVQTAKDKDTLNADNYDNAVKGTLTFGAAFLRGDANGDGSITGTDATIVLRHVAEIEFITDATNLAAADANNDGSVTGTDATAILRHVAEIEFIS